MTIRSIRARAKGLVDTARRRVPVLDHAVRAVSYTNSVSGFQLAAGVTYYAFLSFFPLVALAYSVVGFVVDLVPGARRAVTTVLTELLPTMVGEGPARLDVTQLAEARAGAGVLGLLGLLYAGLGWVSSLRTSLEVVFSGPAPVDRTELSELSEGGPADGTRGTADRPRRGFVATRLADLRGLFLIGIGLLVGIGFGGVLSAGAGQVADALGVPGAAGLVVVCTEVLVVGTMTAVVFATFRLLPTEPPGGRGLLAGSLLAAIGFELLRQLATLVVGQFAVNPLYGAFAVVVALLVWINYMSRLLMLGAAWAVTAGDGPVRRTEHATTPTR